MRTFWKIFWWLSLAAMLYQLLFLFPDLPERMASHFDFSGKADGWSSKGTFLVLWIAAILLVNIWLPLIGWMTRKLPRSMINVPDKDYWFADQKHLAELCSRLEMMMAMILAPVNLVFIYGFQYTYEINTKGSSELPLSLTFIPIIFVVIFPIIYALTKMRAPSENRTRPQ